MHCLLLLLFLLLERFLLYQTNTPKTNNIITTATSNSIAPTTAPMIERLLSAFPDKKIFILKQA